MPQLLIARLDGTGGARRGSLKPLWAASSREVAAAARAPAESLEVDVLDARQAEWLPAKISFALARMTLAHNGTTFAHVYLSGAKVVGHVAKRYVQVFDATQTFVLRFRSHADHIRGIATLMVWATTRPEGMFNKAYTPPTPEVADDESILVCTVEIGQLTTAPRWKRTVAVLKRSGTLVIGDNGRTPFETIDVTRLAAAHIRLLDPSLSGPRVVAMDELELFVRFGNDSDLDDWLVTLKSFAKHLVYALRKPSPKSSVRVVRSAKVTGINVRVARDHPALTPQTPGAIDGEDLDFSNTYLELQFGSVLWGRTYLHTLADVPHWVQSFQLHDIPDEPLTVQLKFSSTGTIADNDISIGSAHVETDPPSDWCPLDNPSAPISIYVKMATERAFVLDSRYYEELKSQVLNLNSGLAYKLGTVVSTDMQMLCDTFFQVYLAERKPTEWAECLITAEIDRIAPQAQARSPTPSPSSSPNSSVSSTESPPTLATNQVSAVSSLGVMFRGNSMMTRGIERYLQTIGGPVLERTIGRFVRKVLNTNDTFELDPSRVQSQLIVETGKKPSQSEIDRIISANRITITNYMVFIWSLIKKEGVPDHFKWIFTVLAESMRTRLGIINEDTIYSAVSAFLFLRFYCPALLNPHLFNLVDSAVTPANQRALTLVAKLLQGFANRIRFGAKEPWLMPMNSFLEKYDKDLAEWYAELISFDGPRPRERDAKELPFEVFMDDQLSNPYLIDEWYGYAKLVQWGSKISFDKSWDIVLGKFFLECKRIDNELNEIIEELNKPDKLQPGEVHDFDIKVNWETYLFSNDPELIELENTRSNKKSVWSKLWGR